MINKDMSKKEIEEFLKGKGEYVQIDHLTRFLTQKEAPLDKKQFIYQKLGQLYEKKGMLREAAKMYGNLALLSVTFSDKIKSYIKEAELCIKAGDFISADESVRKAMSEGNVSQRAEVFVGIKEFYKKTAAEYQKTDKRSQAIRIYEKMLTMNISDAERQEIKAKLLPLYEKTGKIKEYFSVKNDKPDNKHSKKIETRKVEREDFDLGNYLGI